MLRDRDWKSIRTYLPPDILRQAQARADHLGITRTAVFRAAFMYGIQRATPSDMIAYDRRWKEVHDAIVATNPPRTITTRHGQQIVCDAQTGRALRLIG